MGKNGTKRAVLYARVSSDDRGRDGHEPVLVPEAEEFRGGGMNAPVEVPMGMEKLEAGFSLYEFTRENFRISSSLLP